MKHIKLITIGFLLTLLLLACNGNRKNATWTLSSNFVQSGVAVSSGMQVWVYVFDEQGQSLVFERYDLTDSNLNTWQDDITKLLNQGDNSKHVRVRIDPTEEINTKTNYVWLANPKHTFVMGFRQ